MVRLGTYCLHSKTHAYEYTKRQKLIYTQTAWKNIVDYFFFKYLQHLCHFPSRVTQPPPSNVGEIS